MKTILLIFTILSGIILFSNADSSNDCFEYSCEECSDSNFGSCTKCKGNFTLKSGTCPCYDSNCALCKNGLASNTACVLCNNGNSLWNGYCQPNGRDRYCEINGSSGCKKCKSGYELNNNSCVKSNITCYDENCSTCLNAEFGGCKSCNSGYWLTKGTCQKLEEPTINGRDYQCPDGYYVSNDRKSRISYCYPECEGLTCDKNKKTQNIFHSNTITTYDCDNPCLTCQDKQLIINSDCDDSSYCNVSKCLTCYKEDECVICEPGTYLSNGTCIDCVEGCNDCSSSDKCNSCLNGFKLTENGTCEKTTELDFSIESYKSKAESLRLKDEQGSTNPDYSSYKCDVEHCSYCENELCKTCERNYYLENQECIKCSYTSNCNICQENYCLQCDYNYELNEEGKCYLKCKDEHCLTCSDNYGFNKCQKCEDGYELTSSGECKLKCDDSNCSYCPTKTFCQIANSGYYTSKGRCFSCYDSGCSSCSDGGSNSCSSCKDNNYLINGKCAYENEKGKVSHCKYYGISNDDSNNEVCLECENKCELDEENNKCKCSNTYIYIIIFVIVACALLGGIIFLIVKKVKNNQKIKAVQVQNIENIRNLQSNNLVNPVVVPNSADSSIPEISNNLEPNSCDNLKKRLENEFESKKLKEKCSEQTPCVYCNLKPGVFQHDCGCILCKEHAKTKDKKEDNEDNQVCIHCGKVVHNTKKITQICNICLQDCTKLSHFKCGCSLLICKECYVRCKLSNNLCPGCRRPIS